MDLGRWNCAQTTDSRLEDRRERRADSLQARPCTPSPRSVVSVAVTPTLVSRNDTRIRDLEGQCWTVGWDEEDMKRTTESREYDVGRLDVDIVVRWIDARISVWEDQVGLSRACVNRRIRSRQTVQTSFDEVLKFLCVMPTASIC